jgi:hypothetical protein
VRGFDRCPQRSICFLDGLRAILPLVSGNDFPELREALTAEREALQHLREARERVGDLVSRVVADGAPYHAVARVSLRLRLGRAPTLAERDREAQRLRQLRRRTVTRGHGKAAPVPLTGDHRGVLSPKEAKTMVERLIRRRVVEEEFEIDDDEKNERECDDPKAASEEEADDVVEDEDEEDEDTED